MSQLMTPKPRRGAAASGASAVELGEAIARSYLERSSQPAAPPGPTLADYVCGMVALRTEFDAGKRDAVATVLSRSLGVELSGANNRGAEMGLPAAIARSILPGMGVERTGVGYHVGGAGGLGAGIKPGLAPDVVDRRRPTVCPASLVDWWEVEEREYTFAAVNETSRATGKRWGGITSQWGLGETVVPAASDGAVAAINFIQNRLLIYTTVSRDIWTDARKLERWLNVIALSEIRFSIDSAIVNGVLGGPNGIIQSPATVTVSKGATSSGSISALNISSVWSAMYAGSRENCVWLANDDTIQYIDNLATGGQFPDTPYIGYLPAGKYGVPFPTIKGRPLIACEACPIIGSPGDLICVDFTDFIFTYLKAPSTIGGISVSVDVPPGKHATGMIGLPDGAVERRLSDELLFDNDELAIIFKFRGDGKFLWTGTVTNLNGATVGPAAIIAQR